MGKDTEKAEFIGLIIDIFEDFLEERDVTLNNPEVGEAIESGDDPESLAIIYGSDYGDLENRLESLMKAWKIIG